ncbi:MAG TPA: ammonium transporter [bacterium]|nr:ammonium transporter [bacterium]
MKKYLLTLALIAGTAFSALSLRADDTNAMAAPTATAAAAPAAPVTVDQRVADLEAYIMNSGLPSATGKLAGSPGPGHNAWMMVCTALVLFMTLPGLALFYGGLVRRKNVLSVMAQCLGITGLVTILWWICGFSLCFAPGSGGLTAILGDIKTYAFFKDVGGAVGGVSPPWVSLDVFAMFQLTFAIITPALIVGAIAERMKFKAILVFIALWMFIVYFPLAHMVWGSTGLMNGAFNADSKIKAIDFAGGTVVHMSSGWSALILCLILGKRIGFGKENMSPHSMVLCMIGTAMLWVGWYGFNAGSELGADGVAGSAFTTTTLATATASFVWALTEWLIKGKPSVLGFCSGAVAGLVVITPACGWVNTNGAMIIGVAAGIIPFFAVTWLKPLFKYDDALDTFGVHAVGGTLGAILTGILADKSVNSYVPDVAKLGHPLVIEQLKAVGITIVLAVVGTIIAAYITKLLVGLRPTEEVEMAGLDVAEHGEEGYHGS